MSFWESENGQKYKAAVLASFYKNWPEGEPPIIDEEAMALCLAGVIKDFQVYA